LLLHFRPEENSKQASLMMDFNSCSSPLNDKTCSDRRKV
jgi:hypothetical protein